MSQGDSENMLVLANVVKKNTEANIGSHMAN